LLNQIDYDSYGNVIGQSNPSVTFRFGYTGREWDGETGQYFYRARYYDQTTGRFLSTDPIGFAAGDANLYRYVFNSPTNFTDPSGEIAWVPVIILGGIIIPIVANMLVPPNAQAPTHKCDITPPRPWWHEPLVEAGLSLGVGGLTSAGKAGVKGLAGLLDDAGKAMTGSARAFYRFSDDAFPLFRRVQNAGAFKGLEVPMQSRTIKRIAQQAGIGLDGVKVKIIRDPSLVQAPIYGYTPPRGNMIQLFPRAFENSETLVRTLGHERIHVFQNQIFGVTQDSVELGLRETAASGSETLWWQYFNLNK
jgi:RHS repeat-associated protein